MKQNWSEQELKEEWTLSSADMKFVRGKPAASRLVVAVKLKFFEHFGCSIEDWKDVALIVIEYIAKQLGIRVPVLSSLNSRTSRRHNSAIRKCFHFLPMTVSDLDTLKSWVFEHQYPFGFSHEHIRASVYQYLYTLKIEPYSPMVMGRNLKSWSYQFESEFFKGISKALTENNKACLDKLLLDKAVTEDNIILNDLRSDPGKASVKAIKLEIKKLECVVETGVLSSECFNTISPVLLNKYHDYVASTPPGELAAYDHNKKYALLASFSYIRGLKFTDNLIDIFIQVLHKISNKAKKKVRKEFWDSRKIIYNKDRILSNIAEISIEHPRGIIEEKIYPKVGKETLANIVTQSQSFSEYYKQRKNHYMRSSYIGHYRRMLSSIVHTLGFLLE